MGANLSTECVRNPIEWMYHQSDWCSSGTSTASSARAREALPITSILRHKVYLRSPRGVHVVTPLNYVPYHKPMRCACSPSAGWPYPQRHFESRFTKFYESYWLPTKFGYDTRKVQYSSLILTGQMTRDEALESSRAPAYDPATISQDFEYIAAKLRIPVEELQGYLEGPESHLPGLRLQESTYVLGAKVLRWLGIERGGKR